MAFTVKIRVLFAYFLHGFTNVTLARFLTHLGLEYALYTYYITYTVVLRGAFPFFEITKSDASHHTLHITLSHISPLCAFSQVE